jgi:site-specific DNA-methyltransferase (adenine-specific)
MDLQLFCGDSSKVLQVFADNSFDALICDPPAGIGFMGKGWDKDKGGRDFWIVWLEWIMEEVFRVLKPGAHGLVWALPRTNHWVATALENSGFEIRDVIMHVFGSGFPKSQNISKAIDKKLGATRKKIGENPFLTEPATLEAKQWDGWGSALKPSVEHWILVRKPFKGRIADNVLEHGTGAINIDACRVAHDEKCKLLKKQSDASLKNEKWQQAGRYYDKPELKQEGRWPAHLVFSHHPECVLQGTKKVKPHNGSGKAGKGAHGFQSQYVGGEKKAAGFTGGQVNAEGLEKIDNWDCVDECPCKQLGDQSGSNSSNRGGFATAARFFKQFEQEDNTPFMYCAKPSPKEKNEGLGGEKNPHPTIKPVKLLRYFAKLITPPGGLILDCFMGSGSTGVAALQEGFSFVGIELEKSYFEIAKKRIMHEKLLRVANLEGIQTNEKTNFEGANLKGTVLEKK